MQSSFKNKRVMEETILIIEDSEIIRENTSELLEIAGYKVFTANNGRDGLEVAKKNKPDLILCDIMMPELDGYGVLRAIENLPELVGVPFVFITAKSEKSDFRTGMDLGADDYLIKPFDGNDLLKVVIARLKKKQLLKTKFENNLEGLNAFMNTAKSFKDISLLSDSRVIKKIRKKDTIFMEGDSPLYLYFIVSGKVKLFKTNELGKEYITEIFKEGDFFGHTALLDESIHKESASAIDDIEIALIPKEDFYQLLHSNSEISIRFIKYISNNLAKSEEKLIKMAYDSARKRVSEALLFIYNKYQNNENTESSFPAFRENISAIAGISPESVSRNLTDFKEEGLIETCNGIIKIVDIKKLEALKN